CTYRTGSARRPTTRRLKAQSGYSRRSSFAKPGHSAGRAERHATPTPDCRSDRKRTDPTRRGLSLHIGAKDALASARNSGPKAGVLQAPALRRVRTSCAAIPLDFARDFRNNRAVSEGQRNSSNSLAPHTILALVKDRPGVLYRIAACWQEKGFNIRS